MTCPPAAGPSDNRSPLQGALDLLSRIVLDARLAALAREDGLAITELQAAAEMVLFDVFGGTDAEAAQRLQDGIEAMLKEIVRGAISTGATGDGVEPLVELIATVWDHARSGAGDRDARIPAKVSDDHVRHGVWALVNRSFAGPEGEPAAAPVGRLSSALLAWMAQRDERAAEALRLDASSTSQVQSSPLPDLFDPMRFYFTSILEAEGISCEGLGVCEVVALVIGTPDVPPEPFSLRPPTDLWEAAVHHVARHMGLLDKLCACTFEPSHPFQKGAPIVPQLVDQVMARVRCRANGDLVAARLKHTEERFNRAWRLSHLVKVDGHDEVVRQPSDRDAAVSEDGLRRREEDSGVVQLDERIDEGCADGVGA